MKTCVSLNFLRKSDFQENRDALHYWDPPYSLTVTLIPDTALYLAKFPGGSGRQKM